jgi:hypothetical protein
MVREVCAKVNTANSSKLRKRQILLIVIALINIDRSLFVRTINIQ